MVPKSMHTKSCLPWSCLHVIFALYQTGRVHGYSSTPKLDWLLVFIPVYFFFLSFITHTKGQNDLTVKIRVGNKGRKVRLTNHHALFPWLQFGGRSFRFGDFHSTLLCDLWTSGFLVLGHQPLACTMDDTVCLFALFIRREQWNCEVMQETNNK